MKYTDILELYKLKISFERRNGIFNSLAYIYDELIFFNFYLFIFSEIDCDICSLYINSSPQIHRTVNTCTMNVLIVIWVHSLWEQGGVHYENMSMHYTEILKVVKNENLH